MKIVYFDKISLYIYQTEYLEIISGNSYNPFQYRVMTPALVWAFAISGISFNYIYIGLYFIFLFCIFILFHIYLRYWFKPRACFIGCIVLAAFFLYSFEKSLTASSLPILYDIIRSFIFLTGLFALFKKNDAMLFAVIVVGMFCSETTLFLIGLYFLQNCDTKDRKRSPLLKSLFFLLAAGAVYLSMRIYFGSKPYPPGLSDLIFERNLSHHTYFYLGLFFLPLVIFALLNFTWKDEYLKRNFLIIFPFVGIHAVIGILVEIRLFLPVMFILIPLVLYSPWMKKTRMKNNKKKHKTKPQYENP